MEKIKEEFKILVHNKPFVIIRDLEEFEMLFEMLVGKENMFVFDKFVMVNDQIKICHLELKKLQDRVIKATESIK